MYLPPHVLAGVLNMSKMTMPGRISGARNALYGNIAIVSRFLVLVLAIFCAITATKEISKKASHGVCAANQRIVRCVSIVHLACALHSRASNKTCPRGGS